MREENIYSTLLDIPSEIKEPNYYQLLKISPNEKDREKIELAYKKQMQKLQKYGNNPKYKDIVLFLKGELRKAYNTLTDFQKREEYNKELEEKNKEILKKYIEILTIKNFLLREELKYIKEKARALNISLREMYNLIPSDIKIIRNIKQIYKGKTYKEEQRRKNLGLKLIFIILYIPVFFIKKVLSIVDFFVSMFGSLIHYTLVFIGINEDDEFFFKLSISMAYFYIIIGFIILLIFLGFNYKEYLKLKKEYKILEKKLEKEIQKENELKEKLYNLSKPFKENKGININLLMKITNKVVYVPGGYFEIGNKSTKKEDERFVKRIYLDGFYISKYEVSNEEYREFIRDTNYPVPYSTKKSEKMFNWDPVNKTYPKGRGDYPVVLVNWEDAMEFCKWLSKKWNCNVSLPTEAQWEKAAKYPDNRIYPWGNNKLYYSFKIPLSKDMLDYEEKFLYYINSGNKEDFFDYTAPVTSFDQGASYLGILNLLGNVAEWCLDSYDEFGYIKMSSKNPVILENLNINPYKVIRGGSWKDNLESFRITKRDKAKYFKKSIEIGFRYVINLPTLPFSKK